MDEKEKQASPDLSLSPFVLAGAFVFLLWYTALKQAGMSKQEAIEHITLAMKGGDNDGYNSDNSDGQSGL